MKRPATGAGAAETSEMKNRPTLLLLAAALITAALLTAFKAIDLSASESLEPQTVSFPQTIPQTAVIPDKAVPRSEGAETARSETPERAMPKVNINTASVQELASLDGIGEVKAQAIIDWREENGAFRSIEELAMVNGISYTTIEANLDRITTD